MKDYKETVERVMIFLTENQYRHSTITANKSCFNALESYLKEKIISYSPKVADEWFETIKDCLSKQYRSFYRLALFRICDVYEVGYVRLEHDTKHLLSYTILADELKNDLDSFLSELGEYLSSDTVDNYKHTCARFLVFIQRAGVQHISDVSYDSICSFYENDVHVGKSGKHHGNVSTMMLYFYKQNKIPIGFTVIFHYLALGKGCYWNTLSRTGHMKIKDTMAVDETVSVEKLFEYKEALNKTHNDNEYNKYTRTTNNRALDLLILFLDMNKYRYNPEIAMIWFEESRNHFNTDSFSVHRALCIVADYYRSDEFHLETIYRITPRAFERLPEWCREAANKYVDVREKEGWTKSTMNMIRSSICRFCNYLDRLGVCSFKDVDVSHIKHFNINDIHKTAAGKNAYNVRIRKFLLYLGEKGYLTNSMLFISLSCTSAPKETIVVVLTESEMNQLDEELSNATSFLSLRKKAVLLLGLKMGLRSSDIVNLKFDDINWNTASIRFIQEKTAVEVNLPMPAEVGNALFQYIMEERHQKAAPNIFVSEKAPHKPVGRSVCNHALDTALPDRNVEGSGFHVMRKTYATNLLRNGVGANIVADALGQRGSSSVHRYLSLDSDRMRMCSLFFENCGIGGWCNGR